MMDENYTALLDEHRYYGVNVKDYGVADDEIIDAIELLGEDRVNALYEEAQGDFWLNVQPEHNPAIESFGVTAVYAEGRMGGWAVPEPKIEPEDEWGRYQGFEAEILRCKDAALDHFHASVRAEVAEKREADAKSERMGREVYTLTITHDGMVHEAELVVDHNIVGSGKDGTAALAAVKAVAAGVADLQED